MPSSTIVSPSDLEDYRKRRNIPARMPTPLASSRQRAPALYEYYCKNFAATSRRAGFLYELGAVNQQQDLTIRIQREIMRQIELGELTAADQDVMDAALVRTIDNLVGRVQREAYLGGAMLPRVDQDGYEYRPIQGDIPVYRGLARLALRDYVAGRTRTLPSIPPAELPRDFPWLDWIETAEQVRRFTPATRLDYEIAVELLASAKAWPMMSKVISAYGATERGRVLAEAAASRVLDDMTFGSGSAPRLASPGLRALPALPALPTLRAR